jgi:hypothetical protein
MLDLTRCESLAAQILEAYDSQPLRPGDDWLEGEWSFGTGERLRVRGSTRPGVGICRLYGDALAGPVPWVDVPFDWELLRERRGYAWRTTINVARAQLHELPW